MIVVTVSTFFACTAASCLATVLYMVMAPFKQTPTGRAIAGLLCVLSIMLVLTGVFGSGVVPMLPALVTSSFMYTAMFVVLCALSVDIYRNQKDDWKRYRRAKKAIKRRKKALHNVGK